MCALCAAQTQQFRELAGMGFPQGKSGGSALIAADVDGDGDLDLFVPTSEYFYAHSLDRLLLNDGNGRFTDVTTTHLPALLAQTMAAVFEDVDADGDPDLILGNAPSAVGGQNRLYLNDGMGKFSYGWSASPTSFASRGHLVDIDADGDIDYIAAGVAMTIWVNNGKATFTNETARRLPARARWATGTAVADVDGDRDVDLLMMGRASASVANRLLLNDGTGVFKLAAVSRLPQSSASPGQVLVGDTDLDGDLDLVVSDSKGTLLWLNGGKGTFVDASSRIPQRSPSPFRIALFDADLDGDSDLVFEASNTTRGVLLLLPNLHRQVHAKAAPQLGKAHAIDLWAQPGYATTPQHMLPYISLSTLSPRVRIGSFGLLGLDPRGMISLLPVILAGPTGHTTLSLPLPPIMALRGKTLSIQTMTLHSLQLADWRFSNVHSDVLR